MTDLLQQIFSGSVNGLVFGGVALALTTVFQGSGILNFAQGEMAAFTALLSWTFLEAGLTYWAAFVLAIAAAFVAGMLVERVFISPVDSSDELSLLMVTLALFLGINAVSGLTWGYLPKSVEGPFGSGVLDIGGALVTYQQVGMAAVILVAVTAMALFFRFTSAGLRMRAAAANPASARLLGVRVARQRMVGWGLAAAIGAVAAMAAAPVIGVGPDMMGSTLLMAFAAAALGGFGSRFGAVFGGLVVGIATALASTYVSFLGGDLAAVVPFVLIVVVLTFKPTGLFGKEVAVRA